MIRIGIISPFNKENIRRCLKSVLHECASVSKSADNDTLCALEMSGVNFCILDLEKNTCFVDVLILDTNDSQLISKALRAMVPDTRLIYNSDKYPEINHPYAVSYGFSHTSTATVSSVNENSFLICLHPLIRLDNKITDEREYLVFCEEGCIDNAMCAVACGALCGTLKSCNLTIF